MADLWNSCHSGNLSSARKQLERGADVNYRQADGSTCLMSAAGTQNIELVSLLLGQPGIDVNAKNSIGRTALHWATGAFGTPAILRLLLDFPGIDREAKDGLGWTPLIVSVIFGKSAQFAEFLKTPEILLNETRIASHLIFEPEMQKMFAAEQRKREERARKENVKQGRVKQGEKKKKKGQKRKREVLNADKKWKELKLARRRQKATVEEVVRNNKQAEEEMSKEGRVRKEAMEKEFQDKIDALARKIKILENEKKKRIVQMDQELVERQETLSKENQNELNNLVKKHKAENADMLENILDKEDEEDGEDGEDGEGGEDAPKAAPQTPAAPNCPICFEFMSPPTRIFQCEAGHLVCGTCRPRLQECPSRCGQPMLGPAIGLEHFVGKIWTPKDNLIVAVPDNQCGDCFKVFATKRSAIDHNAKSRCPGYRFKTGSQ